MQAALFSLLALAQAGTVGLDIRRVAHAEPRTSGNKVLADKLAQNVFKRADDTIPAVLVNGFYSYSTDLYIGSDKQLVSPSIDTGSSDLWVMLSSNPYCENPRFNCSDYTFDPSTSSTFHNLSTPFDIQYLDTTGAFGFFATDDINVGGNAQLKGVEFALANVANSSEDIFGISFIGDEATVEYYTNGSIGGYTYPNIPINMKTQGLIERVSYSLFLDDIEASTGQLLFGGVDHSKYDGTLGLVPMINIFRHPSKPIDIRIMLSDISVKSGDNACSIGDFKIPVLLDSGTSYALLPQAIIDPMAAAMGYTSQSDDGFNYGPCNTAFGFDSFEIDFSGVKLQVPPATLLDNLFEGDTNNVVTIDGEEQCVLAISNQDDEVSWIFGDVFLRNFYVAYDMEGFQIGIAQANYNTGASNIEEIVTGIPSATTAPSYNNTAIVHRPFTALNYSKCLTSATSTVTPFPSSYSKPASNIAHNSTAQTPSYGNGTAQATTTSSPSAITTFIPTPTVITTEGKTFTVTGATTLTITDCSCTKKEHTDAASASTASGVPAASSAVASASAGAVGASASASAGPAATVAVTEVFTSFVTTCSSPTTFAVNDQTYTVTDTTVISITDCPCTLTHGSALSTASFAGVSSGSSAAAGTAFAAESAAGSAGAVATSAGSASAAAVATSAVPAGLAGNSTESLAGPALANAASAISVPAGAFAAILFALL